MSPLLPRRRRFRRLVAVPLVEQLLRRVALRRVTRRASWPADALVTSTGRGTMVRDELPSPGTRSFDRLARKASRSEMLLVRSVTPAASAALQELAARGAPIRVAARPTLLPGATTDETLWAALTEPTVSDDPDLDRYVRSVRLARVAAGPTPSAAVSVLLATRRPSMLDHAIESIRSQRDVELQLVVGLHGVWPDATEQLIGTAWPGELVTIRADQTTSLGALLGQMAERADGRLLTKWDDDDWYGPHHIGDLGRAHASSNAQLVGKAAEFVWLEAIGETVRRPALGARTYTANLAGGTLMLTKADLTEAGGFPDVPRSVDRLLIDGLRARGGDVYRTHGLEFVLRRSASGDHTWDADTQYFVGDAIARRPGLDLAFAGVPPDDTGGPT